MQIHCSIKVFGKVQGVFFRQSAKEKAQELQVNGYARNNTDGSVYIEAEGEQEKVNRFIEWCTNGPDTADVSHLEINEGVFKNYTTFKVLRDNPY